jgi:hypothetical protein
MSLDVFLDVFVLKSDVGIWKANAKSVYLRLLAERKDVSRVSKENGRTCHVVDERRRHTANAVRAHSVKMLAVRSGCKLVSTTFAANVAASLFFLHPL